MSSLPLIRRSEIGLPAHELPLAANAPVGMGNPDHHVPPRPALDADPAALEADRVGLVSAGGDNRVLYLHRIGAGEAAPDPAPWYWSSTARSRFLSICRFLAAVSRLRPENLEVRSTIGHDEWRPILGRPLLTVRRGRA